MASNTVTLTFAGDSASLDRSLKDVHASLAGVTDHAAAAATSSEALGHELEQAGKNARSTGTVLKGLGGATQLMGGQVGGAVDNLIQMSQVTKELGHGMGGLIERVGVLRVGLAGLAIAGAAAAVAATSNNKGWSNLKEDGFKPAASQLSILNGLVQRIPGSLGPLGGALDSVTNKLRLNAGMSATAAGALAQLAAQAAATKAALDAEWQASLHRAPDVNPGGDGFVTTADLQTIALQSSTVMDTSTVAKAARASGGAIKSVKTAVQTEAQKALVAFKDIETRFAAAVKGIVDSMRPQLNAATSGDLVHQLDGSMKMQGGQSLLDQLKKQAADTKHLKSDLSMLVKGGLDKGLLSALVAGGTGSIGAADELLHGGKSSISQANTLSRSINGNANSIATAEALRTLAKKDKTTLVLDLKGGDGDLKKLIRKWIKSEGGNVQKVLGA